MFGSWSTPLPMLVLGCLLAGLLGLEEARFEFGSLLSHPPRLEAYGAVMSGHGRWDVEQSGLPGEVELRVPATGSITGGSC